MTQLESESGDLSNRSLPQTSPDELESVPEESPLLDAIERFADFVDEVFENPDSRFQVWEGNADRVAIRSIGRLLSKWKHAGRPDRPPYSLIVRLSDRLPQILKQVVEAPKRILQRRRSMQPLDRLREIDSNCIRWITRQPGLSLVEKAGHRRSILAVERFESHDTLENRVVLSLLRLSIARSRDYLRQYRERFESHDRVRSVNNFLRLCQWLIAKPIFSEVSTLRSMPRPNYVLLHDDRYHRIWRGYLDIVRQQRRRNILWHFRQEVFSEMAFLAFQNSLNACVKERSSRKIAHRHEMAIRQVPLHGRVFEERSSPPIWHVSRDTNVFVGNHAFAQLVCIKGGGGIPPHDLFLLRREGGRESTTFIRFDLPDTLEPVITEPRIQVSFDTVETTEPEANVKGVRFFCPANLIENPCAFHDWMRNWCHR
jgi:Domain of unknown function (DUF2357)